MEQALNGRNFRDPQHGYAKFIDVEAAIDHHLLNVVAFNVDAFRLSGYMSLPRNGKLMFGPIWDFDRALGSTDGRDNFPSAWRGSGQGTDFFNYPWWNRMFRDIDFFQKYIDRFQRLRQRQFSAARINGIIDRMADELREAQARNLDRWKQMPRRRYGGNYQGEVNHMKDWLAERIQFMESQFVDPPIFQSASRAEPGQSVRLTSPEGGDIYYTLDGSDPRKPGGAVSRSARKYSSPIALTESVKVTARVRNREHKSLTGANNPPLSSQWSGTVSALYSMDKRPQPGDLHIAELHYNPLPPNAKELESHPNLRARDFEFFELQNQTSQRLELAGLQIMGGVLFAFPSNDSNVLDPGKSAVLVGNREAFALRYGFVDSLIVEYQGALDDDADEIRVVGADGRELIRAAYSDEWHPATDGHGFSLEPLATANPQTPGVSDWRVGSRIGGDPGIADSFGTNRFAVRVNEVLNNSDPPEMDAVELGNFGNETAAIGGWYLTDDLRVPRKYRLPAGTAMEPGSFLVLDETDFGQSAGGNIGFRFNSLGEEVYLFAASNGELQGYADGFRFRALSSGQTQGPWIGTDGKRHIVAFQSPTLGAANSEPLIGPIVISEIFAAPSILSISIENDGVRLEIALNSAGAYSVQRSDQLNGQWEEMKRLVWESETSSTVEVKDQSPQLEQQFYRVVLLP